jgi:hypothetical protein
LLVWIGKSFDKSHEMWDTLLGKCFEIAAICCPAAGDFTESL